MDMEKLAGCIEAGTAWSQIGLPELYGNVTVATTDPTKSNSGIMFAGLLANTLCGGTADGESLEEILPRLQTIFRNLGYMESSSSDLFDQFLKTGIGAKPLVAGYENQLLEFAVENPDTWQQVRDDIRIMYPSPTVWSSHVFIALDEQGAAGIDALMDEEVQKMAWDRHGFRTGINGSASDTELFGVDGVADEVKIDFLGGSLRMDYKKVDGSYDFTKTSLRFGYQIQLPEGAVLESWKWDYGTSEENLFLTVKGENKVPQADGSFVSNLVLTDAPVDKYDTLVYTALSVTYKKDGQTITVTDKTESRSVKAVAEAIVNAPNATEAEKEYARGLLNAFNKNGWTGYY